MMLDDLKNEYDKLQLKYGAKNLDSIYNGGCVDNPDLCFVFMNPTGKNIASSKSWKGLKSPWIGTKNIWDLFYKLNLLDQAIYNKINNIKASDWTEEFAFEVYENVKKYRYFITNLGKCTQEDARLLPNSVYKEYLDLLLKEIEIINPKIVILFGNQVSSIVLNEKISVSTCRKREFIKEINGKKYRFYSVFYPVGNGRFNIDKSIEDIKYIMDNINPKIENYYYHTVSKDNNIDILKDFENILKDGKIKCQHLLNNNINKYNGLDYVSVASYVKPSKYKVFAIDKDSFYNSKISNIFSSYDEYLSYLKLDNYLEIPLSMKDYISKNHSNNIYDYYNYLDSISRRYPVDIKHLYNVSKDEIYKYILEMIDDDILYCNSSQYSFEEYVRNSCGITFVFPKSLEVENVYIIPNLPFEIETRLIDIMNGFDARYSNQIGEYQVKDYIEINKSIGIIVSNNLDNNEIIRLLRNYKYNFKMFVLNNDRLIEL